MDKDIQYMRRALTLAARGFGKTSPNPLVGAVIVKNGKIIGEGWHKKAGKAHAEINAISEAGRETEGATLYVTLEPCSTTGKTPPCTDAIISAKIAKVVTGCLDANPSHSGKGMDILQKNGIKCVCGVEENRCLKLNEAFFYWIRTGMPFILLKMAMTLDGKTATAEGESKWITGPEARKSVQKLRKWADAVMVGGETVRKDSPSLTVRDKNGEPLKNWNQPERLVVSRSMTSEDAERVMSPGRKPVMIKAESASEWIKTVKKLGKAGITAILAEGGSELASSLISAGIINKTAFYIAPKILGGKNSKPVIGGANPSSLGDALDLKDVKIKQIGEDLLITGYPVNLKNAAEKF